MNTIRIFLEGVGFRDGLCSKFMHAADELIHSARVLRADLEAYKKAPDPFGALLSTMHNNHEFEKFTDHVVDTGTEAGVQASPIETVRSRTSE